MLNKKLVFLEARVETKANQICQDTASTLEELKSIVVVVHESQEGMWLAIDTMSNVIQELVHGEASIDDEEETEPTPVSVNLTEEESVLSEELSIPPLSLVMRTGPFTWWLAGILEADEGKASVKDFVISGLPTQEFEESMEANGLSRHSAIPKFKFTRNSMVGDGGSEEVRKMAFVPPKIEEKGKLSMDPTVESSYKLADFLAPTEESI